MNDVRLRNLITLEETLTLENLDFNIELRGAWQKTKLTSENLDDKRLKVIKTAFVCKTHLPTGY